MSKSNEPKPAIKVKGITKTFRIPLDKGRSVKSKILGRAGKGYREFTPLNDISFTVYEGDFFGIVGRNGSGKSTLLKTIAGIYEPTAGRVKINGTLVPFIELGVGFNPNLSGRENVYLNAALLGFSRTEIDDMYDDIVDFAELHDFMEERLQNYSSGMQVRLAFSIAIQAKGDILLLDEVLAVGDTAFQQKCYDYFEQLKKEKKTVILVTHSMANVERFCNRGLLLNSGEIHTIGSNKEVADEYRKLFASNAVGDQMEADVSSLGVVDLVGVDLRQNGQVIESEDQVKPGKFTIEVSLKQNNDQYDAFNVSVGLRGQTDTLLLSHNTMGIASDCLRFKGDSEAKVIFEVDNIYANGGYYLNISVTGVHQDSPSSRCKVLDVKRAKSFTMSGFPDGEQGITHPKVSVDIDGFEKI